MLATARDSAGTLARAGRPRATADLAQRAGLDLTEDVPAVADWLAAAEGPLVLGNYVYADGAANVQLAAAVDALTVRLAPRGTTWRWRSWPRRPTCSRCRPTRWPSRPAAYAGRSAAARMGGWPLRTVSGGRLLRRAYPPGADPASATA